MKLRKMVNGIVEKPNLITKAMKTVIKAKKDLYNNGKCFSKGKKYVVNASIRIEASLMEVSVLNDLGESHIIGSWWRSFSIVDYIND